MSARLEQFAKECQQILKSDPGPSGRRKIASRLEGASRPDRVLISAVTANQLDGEFNLDGPHKIETKEQRVVEAFQDS